MISRGGYQWARGLAAESRAELLSWAVLPVIFVVVSIWAILDGWIIDPATNGGTVAIAAALALLLLPRRYRADQRVRRTVVAAVQLLLFTRLAAMLSYLVVSTDAPLVDASIAAWDTWLGFDWQAHVASVRSSQTVEAVFVAAYYSGLPQMAIITVLLGLLGRRGRVEEFVLVVIVTTLLTIAASGLWPAEGPFKYFAAGRASDLAQLSHFDVLRDGRMRVLFSGLPQGLISMPSLHTALGVIYVYAVRGVPWVFWPLLALNGAMIGATPSIGGHYLVDVLAGAALAVGVVIAYRAARATRIGRSMFSADQLDSRACNA